MPRPRPASGGLPGAVMKSSYSALAGTWGSTDSPRGAEEATGHPGRSSLQNTPGRHSPTAAPREAPGENCPAELSQPTQLPKKKDTVASINSCRAADNGNPPVVPLSAGPRALAQTLESGHPPILALW